MTAFWVKFATGEPGCVELEYEATKHLNYDEKADEARRLASETTGREAIDAKVLPYPTSPRIHKVVHPKYGACPSFCFQPEKCAGKTSCPRPYACDN